MPILFVTAAAFGCVVAASFAGAFIHVLFTAPGKRWIGVLLLVPGAIVIPLLAVLAFSGMWSILGLFL